MSKLKECPFCGGEPYLEERSRVVARGEKTRAAYVRCTVCGARQGWVDIYEHGRKKAKEIAIDLWNQRV